MGVKREFLGWDRPGLAAAVDYLARRFGKPGSLDLRNVVVVVPGSRAGRRLLELLVDWASEQRGMLLPPQIVTLGRLPELLYVAKRPFANALVQHLSWAESLRTCGSECAGAILSSPPAKDDLPAWLALGEVLCRLHRELAADDLDFSSVAACGASLPGFREAKRWQALAEIQQAHLNRLDALGLWDLQTARLYAIRHGECRTQSELIFLATADMNLADQHMIDQVADRATALVVAPQSMADRFDEYGCLRAAAWKDAKIELAPGQIEVVGGPADQAAAAVRTIASWDGRFTGQEIAVGVPDAEIVPFLEQYLRQAGVPTRYGAGQNVRRAGPCRLLEAVADYLDGRRFSAWAALVRHPAVERWLASQNIPGDLLCQLDAYHHEHLPYAVDDRWIGPATEYRTLKQTQQAIDALLAPFSGSRRLDEWSEEILKLLVTLYGATSLDPEIEPDRTVLAACEAIGDALTLEREIPPSIAPSIHAAAAIRLVLGEVEGTMVPALPARDAVELLGWLELALDDSSALVVTGFNEGRVPGCQNADLFLPNALRRALGIEDNDRRYARDAYALCVLAASRTELKLIAGRRSADGSPLVPSRLLFAADAETVASRVRALFSGDERLPAALAPGPSPEAGEGSKYALPGLPGQLRPGLSLFEYEPPRPRPLEQEVTSMRVTEFRDFLACPYRYYLRHRLRLEAPTDAAEELDGGAFGSLAHAVLKGFGESDLAASTDAEEITAWLSAALNRQVARHYGEEPLSAVAVQVEQLRLRLKALARWQADWAAQGWRIVRVESAVEGPGAAFMADGKPMYLRGRIDRIDLRASTGEYCLIDYKTGDGAKRPDQVHRQNDRWVDLQLPLYRHLVRAMGIEGNLKLGYIVLPKDTSQTGFLEAPWTPAELAAADRAAEDVIDKVRRQEFWPPVQPAPDFFEEYAAICADGPFAAVLAAANEEGAEP